MSGRSLEDQGIIRLEVKISNSMKHKPTRILLYYINQVALSCAINKLLFSWVVTLLQCQRMKKFKFLTQAAIHS